MRAGTIGPFLSTALSQKYLSKVALSERTRPFLVMIRLLPKRSSISEIGFACVCVSSRYMYSYIHLVIVLYFRLSEEPLRCAPLPQTSSEVLSLEGARLSDGTLAVFFSFGSLREHRYFVSIRVRYYPPTDTLFTMVSTFYTMAGRELRTCVNNLCTI